MVERSGLLIRRRKPNVGSNPTGSNNLGSSVLGTNSLGRRVDPPGSRFDSVATRHKYSMDKIEAKKKEIEHYEGVLERYGSGRWLDMGRRHLAELKAELVELETMGNGHGHPEEPCKHLA